MRGMNGFNRLNEQGGDSATRGFMVVGLLLCVGIVLACNTPPPPGPAEHDIPDAPYVIGAADVLDIRVWKNPELSIAAPVRPDGKISVPLLDDVHAAGLTTSELKELISRELQEYVTTPDVTVVVTSTLSKRAYVIGAVTRNGPISLSADTRVTDAIAAAGGFAPFANKRNIRIIRRLDGGEVEFGFNYKKYIAGDAAGTNMVLLSGDTVVVAE